MPNDPFESCRLKLSRARIHCDTLENEIRPWYKSNPYKIIKQYHPESRSHDSILELQDGKEPDIERWSLLSADCIHNLRTALDHLAYAFAIIKSGQDPPPGEDRIQFPITDDDPKFRSAMDKYSLAFLRQTSPAMWAAIESVQPYKRPNHISNKLPPFLRLLRDLENQDKHRLLRLVTGQAHRATIDELKLDMAVKIDSFLIHVGPLEKRTKVLSFTTSKPTPDVKYKTIIELTICITFGPRPDEFIEVSSLNSWLVEDVTKIVDFVIYAI